MKLFFSVAILSTLTIFAARAGYAAQAIDLHQQPASILQSFLPGGHSARAAKTEVKELSTRTDFNQTTHIRVKQTYAGFPVWGSEAVVHLPKGVKPSLVAARDPLVAGKIRLDGVFYQDLQQDLAAAPAYIFGETQANKALATAKQKFAEETKLRFDSSKQESQLMVYVDEKQQAHWAFVVSFLTSRIHTIPAKPVYILDAVTFEVYEHWDNIKTASNIVPGGGLGGNGRMGKIFYDGLPGNRPILRIKRGDATKTCYLSNETVIIRDKRNHDQVPSFRCEKKDSQHNNVYWNTIDDAINGGYSPNNDGLYSDMIVRDMYLQWFEVPMLLKNGKPMQVTFFVHDPLEGQNAYYEDGKMVFGDGDSESYPVVAPSVVAHEMSHGFTEQHAGLKYRGESGGLDESFSDMADKAVEYFVYGKNNWDIDAELVKEGGRMLRYMDEPTKDCEGKKPGEACSISHVKDYKRNMNVHFSSGIYNKIFYLLATKWNTHQAFEVMVQANMNYWTATTTFARAACGVIEAVKDYKYDEVAVRDAMKTVGLTTRNCK